MLSVYFLGGLKSLVISTCLAKFVKCSSPSDPIPRDSPSFVADLISTLDGLSNTQSSYILEPLRLRISSNHAKIEELFERGNSSSAQTACAVSKLIFHDQHIDVLDSNYAAEVEENWSTTCWLSAACFVLPSSAVDVAVALRIVTLAGSNFAVRSGGHNPNSGFSSINGSGLLLDLANVTALELSSDRSSLATGPGNRWGDVYAYLDPYNISAVGGRNPAVGVGGLILGGGMPYIPSLYGMACDNVINFEVVLGNSSIINANATANSDLFQVLKGGGPNFGIVTRFDLYTVPLHQVWYNFVLYNQSQNEEISAATVATQVAMEDDSKAGLIFNIDGGQTLIGLIYSASQFAPKANSTVLSMATLLGAESGLQDAQREPVSVAHLVDLDLYKQAYAYYLTLLNFTTSAAADISFAIQPMSKALVLAGQARGGNILGLVAEQQNWFNSLAEWTLDSDAAAGHAAVNNMKSKLKDLAADKGLLLPYEFMNDASFTQNPLGSYGALNVEKMKAASSKYDPAQVFQQLQFGGFKISQV